MTINVYESIGAYITISMEKSLKSLTNKEKYGIINR